MYTGILAFVHFLSLAGMNDSLHRYLCIFSQCQLSSLILETLVPLLLYIYTTISLSAPLCLLIYESILGAASALPASWIKISVGKNWNQNLNSYLSVSFPSRRTRKSWWSGQGWTEWRERRTRSDTMFHFIPSQILASTGNLPRLFFSLVSLEMLQGFRCLPRTSLRESVLSLIKMLWLAFVFATFGSTCGLLLFLAQC